MRRFGGCTPTAVATHASIGTNLTIARKGTLPVPSCVLATLTGIAVTFWPHDPSFQRSGLEKL
ncbi:MAG: hypothetical protein CMJ78_25655 [Planctomycetaceae bacterium]|nr:hypothetical protein [Planctomycetaceae bacterium]